jgi:hypothetical protein
MEPQRALSSGDSSANRSAMLCLSLFSVFIRSVAL